MLGSALIGLSFPNFLPLGLSRACPGLSFIARTIRIWRSAVPVHANIPSLVLTVFTTAHMMQEQTTRAFPETGWMAIGSTSNT
jgi:hypothetical protein